MNKHITIEEIRELSRRSRMLLYGAESTSPAATYSSDAGGGPIVASGPQAVGDVLLSEAAKPESTSRPERVVKITKPLKNALRIMQAQSENNMPFLFRHEAALLAQIKGGASLIEAEKAAIRNNLIVKYALARGKTNICFWEITDQGYTWLGQARPIWSSKGKYLHKFCVHRIAYAYKMRGYDSKIEYRRPNGKLVDLRLSQADHVQYIEVCASMPVEKELANIQKDLQAGPLPDEIILAVTERKMIGPLEHAIHEVTFGDRLSKPVRLILAGDLIDSLEVPR